MVIMYHLQHSKMNRHLVSEKMRAFQTDHTMADLAQVISKLAGLHTWCIPASRSVPY